MSNKIDELAALIDILDTLRRECPWDRKQTNESLRNLTIEECYELCDAIDNEDNDNIKEELGDVLLHILFYAKIAEEKNIFDIGDVARHEVEKLKFRHPHIFSDTVVDSVDDVLNNWEKLKEIEKAGTREGILSGIPKSLPAISKAEKIQTKMVKVGFDWEQREDVWGKVSEELAEVREAVNSKEQKDIEEEFGDLLFSVINACRLYGVSPETALEKCNKKVIARFNLAEQLAKEAGSNMSELNLEQMDEFWDSAKGIIKNK